MSLISPRAVLGGASALALILSACQTAPQPVVPTQVVSEIPTPGPTGQSVARDDLLQGTAEWRPNPQSNWQPVTGTFDLPVGAEIRTGPQGQASVTMSDGS